MFFFLILSRSCGFPGDFASFPRQRLAAGQGFDFVPCFPYWVDSGREDYDIDSVEEFWGLGKTTAGNLDE
jgi:hypothetical protein